MYISGTTLFDNNSASTIDGGETVRACVWGVCEKRERACVWQLSMMVKGCSESLSGYGVPQAYRWNNLQCLQRLPGRGLDAKTFFTTVEWFETEDTDQYPNEVLEATLHLNVDHSLPLLLCVGRKDIRK